MSLIKFTNSWVSEAEANAYLADTFGAEGWESLSSNEKGKCLITAFRWIYNYPGVNIPKTSTDEKVKSAQIELAWWIYQNYTDYKSREALIASGVERFTLSKWSETLTSQDLPAGILDILGDSLVNLGGYFPTVKRELNN